MNDFENRVLDYLQRLDEKVDQLTITETKTDGRVKRLEEEVEEVKPILRRHGRALAAILLVLAFVAGGNPAVASVLKGFAGGL